MCYTHVGRGSVGKAAVLREAIQDTDVIEVDVLGKPLERSACAANAHKGARQTWRRNAPGDALVPAPYGQVATAPPAMARGN